jgi:phage terminase large subunit-like protein
MMQTCQDKPTLVGGDEIARLRELGRQSLYFFAKAILGFTKLTVGLHLPICQKLERGDWQELMVVLPRGWFKSTMCTIAFPLWLACREGLASSSIRVLIVQNSQTNAEKKLGAIADQVLRNPLFRLIYPDVLPTKQSTWRSDSICLNRNQNHPEGTFECAGTKTKTISRHYDLIIEDDTVAPDLDQIQEENLLPSKDDIAQAIGFHQQTFCLRVTPKSGRQLVVGTRWFDHDLISEIKKREPSFQVIERGATETDGVIDPNGQPVFPEEFDLDTLEKIKARLGPYLYNCLYLNQPTNPQNMTFQREWFRYYDTEPKGLYTFTTVDLASDPDTAKGQPDFNVVMTCGVSPIDGQIFVLDYFRKQCSPGETIEALLSHVRMWGAVKVGIGAVAYENTFLYWLRRTMIERRQYFLVEKVAQSHRSKAAKIMGLQPVFASGCLKLRTWMRELENELLIFPLGRNDDLADALSMQLELWQVTRNMAAHQEPEINPIEDPMSFEGARLRIEARKGPKLGLQVTEWEGENLVMAGHGGDSWDCLDN